MSKNEVGTSAYLVNLCKFRIPSIDVLALQLALQSSHFRFSWGRSNPQQLPKVSAGQSDWFVGESPHSVGKMWPKLSCRKTLDDSQLNPHSLAKSMRNWDELGIITMCLAFTDILTLRYPPRIQYVAGWYVIVPMYGRKIKETNLPIPAGRPSQSIICLGNSKCEGPGLAQFSEPFHPIHPIASSQTCCLSIAFHIPMKMRMDNQTSRDTVILCEL